MGKLQDDTKDKGQEGMGIEGSEGKDGRRQKEGEWKTIGSGR